MPPDNGEQSPVKRRRSETRSEDYPVMGGQETPLPRTEEPYADVDDDIVVDYRRPNTSAVRYSGSYTTASQRSGATTSSSSSRRQQPTIKNTTASQQRSMRTTTQQQKETKPRRKRNIHWLFYVGIGMIAMLVLWMAGSTAVSWGREIHDNLTYGYPRTYQTDAVVGHNDDRSHPSHFIAMNLNRQAVVIEFMGGDPGKAITYVAPVYIAGNGGDLAPVTLEFRDATGDSKPDMIIHIHLPSQDQISVFVNDGTKFRPSNGNDKIRV